LADPNTISAVRRPGVLDGRYCDLAMDLVIEIHIPTGVSQSFAACIDLLRAALPARFAGGTLHPPSLYEERNWCSVYQEKSELFTVLSRLPRYGCWIYPSDDDSLSVERLGETLVLDPRLRPVATGFVFLEEPVEREGSIEALHVYAESAIGTALCINPVEMRLAGQKKFFSTGFWQLSDVGGAILMNGH